MKKLFLPASALLLTACLLLSSCGGKEGGGGIGQETHPVSAPAETLPVTETAAGAVTNAEEAPVFTAATPAGGEECRLVSQFYYDFYTSYTSPASYGSSAAFRTPQPDADPLPVVLSWEFSAGASGYTVRLAEGGVTEDGSLPASCSVVKDVKEPALTLEDLFTGKDYVWQVTAHTAAGDVTSPVYAFRTAESMRFMKIEGLENARDLGGSMTAYGVRMKQGVVYRSAQLNFITSSGKRQLMGYGLKTDFDLRSSSELEANGMKGDPLSPKLGYKRISGVQYRNTFEGPDTVKAELMMFADPANLPMIFHCAAGRDRTGTLAALVKALCGVSELDIMRDYELTYIPVEGAYSVPGDKVTKPMKQSFLPFLDFLRAEYDTDDLRVAAERFAYSVGLTEADVNAIRANLLEDGMTPLPSEAGWEPAAPERLPESDLPILSLDAEDLMNAYETSLTVSNIRSVGMGDGFVTFTADKDGESFMYLSSHLDRLGSAVVVRYRTTASPGKSYMEFWIDSKQLLPGTDPTLVSSTRENLTADGEWHVLIIDLESAIRDYDGISSRYFRIDLLNKVLAGESIDVSHVATFTHSAAAEAYAEKIG